MKELFSVLALVFLLGWSSPGWAGKPSHAENLTLTEENGVVTVCYDLALDIARVTLVGTGDGKKLTINAVSGDVGIVFGPAKGLCIAWEVRQDYPEGLDGVEVSLDVYAKAYQPPQPERQDSQADQKGKAQAVNECIMEKVNKGMKSERDAVAVALAEYTALLSNDQTYYLQLLQKLKGGVPYVRRYERDREGRQIPIYDTQQISERERAKIEREIDNVLDKAEKNPDGVISSETRRARERAQRAVSRLFTRIAGACEQETGVAAETILNITRATIGSGFVVPVPFEEIRRQKDWE